MMALESVLGMMDREQCVSIMQAAQQRYNALVCEELRDKLKSMAVMTPFEAIVDTMTMTREGDFMLFFCVRDVCYHWTPDEKTHRDGPSCLFGMCDSSCMHTRWPLGWRKGRLSGMTHDFPFNDGLRQLVAFVEALMDNDVHAVVYAAFRALKY